MTTTSARRKGDKAEREVRALLNNLLGLDAPRIRAGATDDVGDLALTDTTIQVKSYVDVGRAVRECVDELDAQHAHTNHTFAAGFVRRPGGRYFVVLTPEMWSTYWREATS